MEVVLASMGGPTGGGAYSPGACLIDMGHLSLSHMYMDVRITQGSAAARTVFCVLADLGEFRI